MYFGGKQQEQPWRINYMRKQRDTLKKTAQKTYPTSVCCTFYLRLPPVSSCLSQLLHVWACHQQVWSLKLDVMYLGWKQ